MARHEIPLPNYPAVLLEEGRTDDPERLQAIFEALCRHYGLVEIDRIPQQTQALWARLGIKLAEDFVPAYRKPKNPGRPKKNASASDDEIAEFIDAGGSLSTARYMAVSYVHALFVLVINAAANRPADAFRQLASGTAAGKAARARLPARYQRLNSVKSFEAAWAAIPEYVRKFPRLFIPRGEPVLQSDRPVRPGFF